MKKFEEGILGFFFDSEEGCALVMNKKIVTVHGLPTRCLSETNNAPILTKKVGQLVKTDGKRKKETVRGDYLRCWIDVWISHPIPTGFFLKAGVNLESWIQFKYEKLPFLCFNCGKLVYANKECTEPTVWVNPAVGPAVRMYGLWIKVDGARGNCFMASGSRYELVNVGSSMNGVKMKAQVAGRGRPNKEVQDGTLHGASTTMQHSGNFVSVNRGISSGSTAVMAEGDVVHDPTIPNVYSI
ncbi:hypothetical protein G4B88_005009 [Cannabis sativa]|uniref:Zinc knuckle CX2CX4HX4C domain-containing protein n=1 Tax=Cannabis sativa TaxID=3483 RepID=A0A7J6H5F2_CANSA|nr:hypothetical protein G4B88_005009 [Cannabis sativa]